MTDNAVSAILTVGTVHNNAYHLTPIKRIEQDSITNSQTVDELCKTMNLLIDQFNQLTEKVNSILINGHLVNNYSSYNLQKYNDQYDSN